MWTPTTRLSPLDEFASDFIADINHHSEVRSEALAKALRSRFDVLPFPQLAELQHLCQELGVPVWKLQANVPEVWGMNFSYEDEVHIAVQSGLRREAQESTIVHEIRETLENAFQRVKPGYQGLPTHDNGAMNRVSDRFAGYLLMETEASRALLREVGFDFAEFARRTGRPLPAVLMRLQQLFPASYRAGPVLGTWLFDAEWSLVESRKATSEHLEARYIAKLNGFSQRRGTMTGRVFPQQGARLVDFDSLKGALHEKRACSFTVEGMGLTDDLNYLTVVEPMLPWGVPWRALVTAVRLDGVSHVAPLLTRLNPRYGGELRQQL